MSRKTVFYTDSPAFGGNEQALLRLIASLDRECWRPVLFYHPAPGLAPLLERALQMDVQIKAIPPLPLGTAGFKRLPSFIRMLKAERPAVFHAYLTWPLSCKWGLVGANLARVPAVLATENLFLDIHYSLPARLQQRWIASGVGRYIAISGAIARQLSKAFWIPASKVQVIYNGIPLACRDRDQDPALRSALTGNRDRPVVMTLARLDPQKGLRYLVEAAAEVPEALFVLVGDGPERASLEAQAHGLGLQERVSFLGYRTDYADLFTVCDLFVLPSLYEGMPLSLMEAMAAGMPVITTAIPGCDEIVAHGETGWSVPPGDPKSLARAVRTLLSDPALAQRLAQAGRARIGQGFSVESMTRQVTGLYRKLLEEAEE